MGDLRIMPRADDWTPLRGLLGAAKVLAVRSIIVGLVLGAALLAIEWLSDHAPWRGSGPAMLATSVAVFIAVIVLGYAVGRAIAHQLIDVAGSGGAAVAALAMCFALIALSVGAAGAHFIRPSGAISPTTLVVVMAVPSFFPIVRAAILEDL